MDIVINSKPFESVFEKYIQRRKVDIAKELNRRAANIIMKAMEETPRVDAGSIPKELGADLIRVNQRMIKSGKRKGMLTKGKLVYAANPQERKPYRIFNWRRRFRPDSLPQRLKGNPTGNKKMKGLISKFISSVKSSCGYIGAGWIPALKVFLTASKGQSLKTNDASKGLQRRFKYIENNKYAKAGYGNLANPRDVIMRATFGNAARGADKVAKQPLITAMNREVTDMKLYIEGKIMGLSGAEINRLAKL